MVAKHHAAGRQATWGTGRITCATEMRRYEGPEVASLYFEGVGGFVFADLVAEVVVDGF